MSYDPQNVSVVFTDSEGKQHVMTGLDTEIFTLPKHTLEDEYQIAEELMDELNKALVNFPFKIPFSYHVEMAVEEILQHSYTHKAGSFATIPRVHIDTSTRLFGFTMISAKENMNNEQ